MAYRQEATYFKDKVTIKTIKEYNDGKLIDIKTYNKKGQMISRKEGTYECKFLYDKDGKHTAIKPINGDWPHRCDINWLHENP